MRCVCWNWHRWKLVLFLCIFNLSYFHLSGWIFPNIFNIKVLQNKNKSCSKSFLCWALCFLKMLSGQIIYFTNLDFPEIIRFPFLSYILGAQVVWGRYNLTKWYASHLPNLSIRWNTSLVPTAMSQTQEYRLLYHSATCQDCYLRQFSQFCQID